MLRRDFLYLTAAGLAGFSTSAPAENRIPRVGFLSAAPPDARFQCGLCRRHERTLDTLTEEIFKSTGD